MHVPKKEITLTDDYYILKRDPLCSLYAIWLIVDLDDVIISAKFSVDQLAGFRAGCINTS